MTPTPSSSRSWIGSDAGFAFEKARVALWTLENEDTHSRPSANTLFVIAEALGVLMSDLLGRTLTHDTDEAAMPASLRDFAEQNDLPEADIRMLASVQFRGDSPTSVRRWEYIYNAIRNSERMDAQE